MVASECPAVGVLLLILGTHLSLYSWTRRAEPDLVPTRVSVCSLPDGLGASTKSTRYVVQHRVTLTLLSGFDESQEIRSLCQPSYPEASGITRCLAPWQSLSLLGFQQMFLFTFG